MSDIGETADARGRSKGDTLQYVAADGHHCVRPGPAMTRQRRNDGVIEACRDRYREIRQVRFGATKPGRSLRSPDEEMTGRHGPGKLPVSFA
jgi:hypothetical protein